MWPPFRHLSRTIGGWAQLGPLTTYLGPGLLYPKVIGQRLLTQRRELTLIVFYDFKDLLTDVGRDVRHRIFCVRQRVFGAL